MTISSAPIKVCNTCGRKFMSPEDFLSNTSRWRICDSGHLWFNCSCQSTGVIIKGKFDWYDPSSKLSTLAQSVFNELPLIQEMPRIPYYIMELQQLLEDEKATTQQMAKIIKHDAMLATSILKVANHQKSRNSGAIKSISHAIAFVGPTAIHDMILLAAVSRFELRSTLFNSELFWGKSFLTGRIAEALVKILDLNFAAELAFLAGSTCNIGKLVLAIHAPAEADSYCKDMQSLQTLGTWSDAEKRYKGFPHTILGEIGAAIWGFNDELLDSIARHHEGPSRHETIALWELVAFANQLSHWVNLEPNQISQVLVESYRARFNLSVLQLDQLVENSLLPLRQAD